MAALARIEKLQRRQWRWLATTAYRNVNKLNNGVMWRNSHGYGQCIRNLYRNLLVLMAKI